MQLTHIPENRQQTDIANIHRASIIFFGDATYKGRLFWSGNSSNFAYTITGIQAQDSGLYFIHMIGGDDLCFLLIVIGKCNVIIMPFLIILNNVIITVLRHESCNKEQRIAN